MTYPVKIRNMVFQEVNTDEKTDPCGLLSVSMSTPINYTLTHFADHSETLSHDQINRYLAKARLTPLQVWEHVKPDWVQTGDGYIIFDDTTIEKQHAKEIGLARPQYSGNAGKVVTGIGVVPCVSVNATLDRSGLIDYRITIKTAPVKRSWITSRICSGAS